MVREQYDGFRSFRDVTDSALADLQLTDGDLTRITISGGGDPSCYPHFGDLVDVLGAMEAPLHIGYTSGKGFDDPAIAGKMIDAGLSEVSFTLFAADAGLRKRYMHDPTPEVSLDVVEKLAGEIDLYAAAVILPGINDGYTLYKTCEWLEDRGAKGLILMRFANSADQGLILGNAPVIEGARTQSVDSFRQLVNDISDAFAMKITGTPLYDPEFGSPFAILSEPDLIDKLPRISGTASVITGAVAAPFLKSVLEQRGDRATVVPVAQEIGCLITIRDLEALDLSDLEETVVIPGRAFVHDAEAARVLSADGVQRTVVRGPEMLTADGETSMGMSRTGVLQIELDGFRELICTINQYGDQ
jgi:methanogenesis marker radical SAM protein